MAEKAAENDSDMTFKLEKFNLGTEYHNLSIPELVEHVIRRKEGTLGPAGTVMVTTGAHTGRSPKDKFVVQQPPSQDDIWWGSTNQPMSQAHFDGLYDKMKSHFDGSEAYVLDAAAAADPDYRLPVRVITSGAWHSLFSHHIFRRLSESELEDHQPEFTIIQSAQVEAEPEKDGTNTGAFIVLNFEREMAIIGGTLYAGEIKKTIFTVLNYLLPKRGVMTMHCSANQGDDGDVTLFFGLSGTGKTTLSSDLERGLIGDDEHAWGDQGVFNIEGGCYAKMIRLEESAEPVIWHAAHSFGAVMENVVFDPQTREIDFEDDSLTENTRGAYPIECVTNYVPGGMGGHPRNIFFLAADAFGVLPPISRLDPDQAMYYFLSGYTAKLAGTEKGVGSEPQATFSTCFAAPFLPLKPSVYAQLLKEKIKQHGTNVWLLNTGWTGGPYGVGHRIALEHTRAMVRAALRGRLDSRVFHADPVFGLAVPESCPGVPTEVLDPRGTWDDPVAYDKQAKDLASRFRESFERFADQVPDSVRQSGPEL
jgi:phosphoenolpyruvate carboxykinase (ATP)